MRQQCATTAFEPTGSRESCKKGEQVHALVLRLLEQRVDPAVVAAHEAERAEVAVLGGDHAGDARNGLEHDGAMPITFGEKRVSEEAKECRLASREKI